MLKGVAHVAYLALLHVHAIKEVPKQLLTVLLLVATEARGADKNNNNDNSNVDQKKHASALQI